MFEGFGIQFMTGAALFGVLNLLSLFTMLFFILLLWVVAIVFTKEDKTELKDFKGVVFAGVVGIVLIGLLIPSMVVTPRVVIQVDESEAMIEHRQPREAPLIITPEPRTQTLQGFRPLTQND